MFTIRVQCRSIRLGYLGTYTSQAEGQDAARLMKAKHRFESGARVDVIPIPEGADPQAVPAGFLD